MLRHAPSEPAERTGISPPVVTRHAAASQTNLRSDPEALSCRRYDRATRPGGAWLWEPFSRTQLLSACQGLPWCTLRSKATSQTPGSASERLNVGIERILPYIEPWRGSVVIMNLTSKPGWRQDASLKSFRHLVSYGVNQPSKPGWRQD